MADDNGMVQPGNRYGVTGVQQQREKMLRLREELLAVEEDRALGRAGCTPDELDAYLTGIIKLTGARNDTNDCAGQV